MSKTLGVKNYEFALLFYCGIKDANGGKDSKCREWTKKN